MVFSVSLYRETKKRERYKTLYVEADTFSAAEERALNEIEDDEDFDGFEISSISKETDRNVLR